jgi:ABC-2 type transport system ATP-binding protein
MIMSITAPDSGSIEILGRPMDRVTQNRIGYLPEERGLYRKMKVIDHLYFLAAIKEVGREEARRRITDWLDKMELRPWLNKKVDELSKGMQQKIQFIATLLHEPDFIIMDEPFGGLDPVNAALLKDVLLELKKQGKTILFSTHRMDQVEKLCDSICLINRGKSVLQGDLKEIKARYGKNNVQIEYEGDGNFLDHTQLVGSYNNYGKYVEVRLAPGADAQQLLRLVSERSRVSKFELVEPSLEEIFIETVGKTDA